jgi:hypothetical protein
MPYYSSKVIYLRGTELVRADLRRADIKHASAVFVIANRYVEDSYQVDSETIMRCLAVRSASPSIKIFVHIIKTENKEHAQQAGVFRTICLEEMTMVTFNLQRI